ncbi:EscF/YscF/HrpA family type III secretion system needle major subunit [Yanghanlia caeni]|uniref:EscF/YscF/HrpA family type III secretion system needle major subunit n=1 Tax=Yanghanlia caeni TaxID=3064283 RepID=A0ABU1D7X6_9BURK|nr:EscF/YscF/HrpA family type III secretion system needle major subunit [Alcaligenaceae bacterium LG-2]NGR07918.1 type III secretion protein [bacterium SGD-2]HLU79774.1 EscF/YscF/HrpA family type III secretion system needle major subunit [Burkholderiaceae bacterium]
MALNGPSGASGLNFNAINNTIYNSIRTQETRLRDTISSLNTNSDGNISQTDLLKLQQQTQQWTMMIELQSTITKQIADSLKGIIQKSS